MMEVNPKKSSDKSDQRYFENKLHLIDVDSACLRLAFEKMEPNDEQFCFENKIKEIQ